MKTLLFLVVFTSGIGLAQTNVIAAKSHSSSQTIDKNDADNFGELPPMRFIQEVKYLKSDCIVEKYKVTWSNHDTEYDTICDHPFLKKGSVDIDRIKAMYPEGTTFKRFDKLDLDAKRPKKVVKQQRKEERNQKKSNGIFLFLIGGGLFLIYLFIPKLSPKHS